MKFRQIISLVCCAAFASSCVSGEVLESAASTNTPLVEQQEAQSAAQTAVPTPSPNSTASSNALAAIDPQNSIEDNGNGIAADGINAQTADDPAQDLDVPAVNGPSKTYLINGLLSAVPFIGYGFRNLNKKMPEAKLFSYMGVVEGPAAIAPAVIKEAEAAYRADPTTAINLIGISLGADLITVIAEKLAEKNVPVNYLGIVDGTNLRPIPSNVRIADNLTCSNLDCTKAKAKLAPGNTRTKLTRKVYQSSHIPLGDHDGMHAHVIAQSASR